jgi:hypothetical protein
MPDRQPKPMSVVPPSPPWATTRTSLRPLTRIAAAMPVPTARRCRTANGSIGICHEVSG